MRLGILSDTHGLLRPEALERVAGCDRILHAGDVGDPAILDKLGEIAPVTAVRGNTDHGELARLPDVAALRVEGVEIRMTHRRDDIPPAWRREARLIVYGHSHRPEMEWIGDCLLLNPGAIGARRFKLPLTLAVVTIRDGRLIPEILGVE